MVPNGVAMVVSTAVIVGVAIGPTFVHFSVGRVIPCTKPFAVVAQTQYYFRSFP